MKGDPSDRGFPTLFEWRGPAVALVCALLAAGAVGAAPPEEAAGPADSVFDVPAEAAAAISEAFGRWREAFGRGDAEALAAVFADDGLYAANTGEVLRGRAEIRDAVNEWEGRRAMFLEALGFPGDSRIDVQEEVLRFRGAGDAVYRFSRLMVLVEPSRCALDAGHVLGVWRRQADGEWRLESLLGNRDRRPPAAACGTRSAPR